MGQLFIKPTVVQQQLFHQWVLNMHSCIELDFNGLGQFSDFFFVSSAFGTKSSFDPFSWSEGVTAAFPDIDFSLVEPNMVYFDLATNLFGASFDTLIWRVDPSSTSPTSSPMIRLLFPGASLVVVSYEHHIFGHFKNLGGFRYTGKSANGLGHYKIYMAQTYMGFKVPFFSRSSSGSRHTIDIDINKLYNEESIYNFVSITSCTFISLQYIYN